MLLTSERVENGTFLLRKAMELMDPQAPEDRLQYLHAQQVERSVQIADTIQGLVSQFLSTGAPGTPDLALLGTGILSELDRLFGEVGSTMWSRNVSLAELHSISPGSASRDATTASSLVVIYSFHLLFLIDQTALLEGLTGITLDTPRLRSFVNRTSRIDLAVRIIRLVKILVTGPQDIALCHTHRPHLCFAQETLAVLQPSMLPEAELLASRMYIAPSTGDLDIPHGQVPGVRRFAFTHRL